MVDDDAGAPPAPIAPPVPLDVGNAEDVGGAFDVTGEVSEAFGGIDCVASGLEPTDDAVGTIAMGVGAVELLVVAEFPASKAAMAWPLSAPFEHAALSSAHNTQTGARPRLRFAFEIMDRTTGLTERGPVSTSCRRWR